MGMVRLRHLTFHYNSIGTLKSYGDKPTGQCLHNKNIDR